MRDSTPRLPTQFINLAGLALVFGVTLVGCGSAHHADESAIQVVQKPLVSVEAPRRETMSNVVEIPADVAAWQSARLFAKVAGYLRSISVDKGDHVVAGQLLATIDSPETEEEAARADFSYSASKAAQSQSEAELNRAGAQVDEMQAEIEGSRARVDEAKAAELRAQSDLTLSQATYRRIKSVYDRDHGLVAQQDVDVAEANLNGSQTRLLAARQGIIAAHQEVLEAQSKKVAAQRQILALRAQTAQGEFQSRASQSEADRAQTLAGYTEIRAPFSGIITERYLDPGALIQNSATNAQQSAQPVVSIADVSTVRVYAQVPESDLPNVHRGTQVTLLADELPGKAFKGKVTRMAGRLDSDTRSMLTEVDLPNVKRLLHPGMLLHEQFWLGHHRDVLTIPISALSGDADHRQVFVVLNGAAHRTNIKTGYQTPDRIEVTSGLKQDDRVIVEGKDNVQDGAAVEVEKPHQTADAARVP